MIINLYVAADLAIALFALVVGIYAALKAYRIDSQTKTGSSEQKYELEKDFALVSTVGWLTFATRIIAIPLFWLTVISLITSVPGAMCEYGVFQAGAPFSWIDLAVKFVTMFAFGGWLFFDFMNRKMKGAPFMKTLSRVFVLLLPLLLIDAILDIAFFGGLKPLVVPCCMVAYSGTSSGLFDIGCPFCFITYTYPLLWGVIVMYALAVGLVVWSLMFRKASNKLCSKEETLPLLSKALEIGIILAVLGTVLLVMQLIIGPFS